MLSKRLLIAAGGTGGHISAGIAVAQTWEDGGGEVDFIGGGKEIEKEMYSGYSVYTLKVRPLKGIGLLNRVISTLLLPFIIMKAILLVRKLKPDVVLGIGGYVAGPVCFSAWIIRVPFGILEQNSVIGFTNRLLDRFASVVFTGFKDVIPPFKNKNVIYSGNPVRKEVVENVYLCPRGGNRVFTLLVIGGSQGARFLNERMPEVVKALKNEGVELKVIHQTGSVDYEKVRKFYSQHNISAEVFPFEVRLYERFRNVDLAVSRAGAMSITELGSAGIPVILIPYPYSADNHQQRNAEIVEKAGGGICILQDKADVKTLRETIKSLILSAERRERMADAMRRMIMHNSAEIICRRLKEICSEN